MIHFPFVSHPFIHILTLQPFPTRRSSDLYLPSLVPSKMTRAILLVSISAWHFIPMVNAVGIKCQADMLTNNIRSEEHTSELQSRGHLVCRLVLEKKKNERINA